MTATDPQLAAMLAHIDAEPDNPDPVAVLGDWFEDHSDVRAECIQWAMKWGRMPLRDMKYGYFFTTRYKSYAHGLPDCYCYPHSSFPTYNAYHASEAWLALCGRWAEMTADEREMVERESERVWGGAA